MSSACFDFLFASRPCLHLRPQNSHGHAGEDDGQKRRDRHPARQNPAVRGRSSAAATGENLRFTGWNNHSRSKFHPTYPLALVVSPIIVHYLPQSTPFQERSQHRSELQRQLQQLSLAKKEKRQLKDELEALRSKDKQLRDRIGQLEAILHKVERFKTNHV